MMLRQLVLIMIVLVSGSCNGPGSKPALEATTVADFKVEGMVCEMGCAKMIEEHLTGIPGVISAKVAFADEAATVSFDQNQISAEQILEEVAKAGEQYKTSDLQLKSLQKNTGEPEASGNPPVSKDKEVGFQPLVFPDIFQNPRKFF